MPESRSAPDVDCLVVGAGVIGLAAAYHLANAGREVVVLEAENAIGQGISSRNSEVIHAGLYYPKGSAKARFCVEGRRALYDFCRDFGVAHKRREKIIVAANEAQCAMLSAIQAKAGENGVEDLRRLSPADLAVLEPALQGAAGLLSPSTGIIDSHGYMLALQGAIEAQGGMIALNCSVTSARCLDGRVIIQTDGAARAQISARSVVLAGGLGASALARSFAGLAPESVPQTFFARGNYFGLGRRAPFDRLIYPVPEPGGLGVHLTLDLGGQARFGPDVEWLDESDHRRLDYRVDPARAEKFYAAIRRYWPGLQDGELVAAYAGVRPKIVPRGAPDADFMIHDANVHGAQGVVALYGVESPGLTASLALGQAVAQRLGR